MAAANTMNNVPKERSARGTIVNGSGIIQAGFFRFTMEYLKEILQADRAEVEEMQQELALLEQASLCIHKHGGRFFFCAKAGGSRKETGITQDPARIYSLARRTYLRNRIEIIESNCRHMSKLIDLSESICHELKVRKKLARYSEAGLDLSRIIFTKKQNEWIDSPYTPNPYYPEDLQWPTTGNIIMRSKSEAKIGSALEAIGWPYRYDDFVSVGENSPEVRPFRKSYFADFKVPNLAGGITVHEHLGAFQMNQYSENALRRLNDYHNFNICELPGRIVTDREITFSFESDLKSTSLLQRLLRKLILPLQY